MMEDDTVTSTRSRYTLHRGLGENNAQNENKIMGKPHAGCDAKMNDDGETLINGKSAYWGATYLTVTTPELPTGC